MKPLTNKTICTAIRHWMLTKHLKKNVIQTYGHISNWDTSLVTHMAFLFYAEPTFNQDISQWDVSNVTDMSFMFCGAHSFNQNISRWDTSNVTTMHNMFFNARRFNQDISKWDTSSVKSMRGLFNGAYAFNQNISSWNVSLVTDIHCMFHNALSFDQDISQWAILPEVLSNTNCILNGSKLYDNLMLNYYCSHPFNLPKTHKYHNWNRRKMYIHFLKLNSGLKKTNPTTYCNSWLDIMDMTIEVCTFL
jgi:surface protein